MASSFIGRAVSINCGDVLGTYQGFINDVDGISQTITIKKAFRNGVHCQVPQITLDARDIKLLKFIDIPSFADNFSSTFASSCKVKDTNKSSISMNGASNIFDLKKETLKSGNDSNVFNRYNDYENSKFSNSSDLDNVFQKKLEQKLHRKSPNHMTPSICNIQKSNGEKKKYSSDGSNGDSEQFKDNITRSRANSVQLNNSASECSRRNKRQERFRKHSLNDDGMDDSSNFYTDDFDFEKNLALFDKRAIYEEIEKKSFGNSKSNFYTLTQNNYKCHENVIPSKPTEYRQITVPGSKMEYVTDSGLIVPCLPEEDRKKLRSVSESRGFHLIENVGRSLAEMVMQLSGGPCRLTPKNSHQHPSVVVICGAHSEGAMSINCARQLAVRNLLVTIFMQPKATHVEAVNNELNLFKMTMGKIVTKISDLPNGPVDMIISSLENDDNVKSNMSKQDWYEEIISWIKLNKAPVIALEPPANGTIMDIKWAMVLGLPPQMALSYTQLYLCDLGFPPAIFNEIGITYSSPFGHKYVVALHRKCNSK